MKIPSIITNKTIDLLSGLANNSDSIMPMTVKDTISNCAIVETYKKNGGKDDARERAIEEFGTGAVWLFGIPLIKKLIDVTVYPLLKLNPNFDIRLLKNKANLDNVTQNANTALKNSPNNKVLKEAANTLNSLDLKNSVLTKFKNKDLYKGLFIGKFALSTALSAFALTKIIKYKQKTTQRRIEKEIGIKQQDDKKTRAIVDKSVKKSNVYNIFTGNSDKKLSFKGGLDLFMYNNIANTSILDGVITATRLKEARKGEKKEVALKEAFQIFFIYAIAKPTQLFFEKIGRRINMPIEMDPKVLFSKNVKQEVRNASELIKNEGLDNLSQKELLTKIYQTAKENIDNPLLDILNKNGNVSITDKNGSKAFDYLKTINEKDLKKAIGNILSLNEHIDSNLKGIKAYKIFSIFANIAIGALAMGVLQPMVNIGMRKLLNNGDNRNPAIVAQEKELQFKAQQSKLQ